MTTTTSNTQDAGAGILAALTAPNAPRAVLVSLNQEGRLTHVPVADAQSIVDIEHELIDHLDNRPHSDAWLTELRDCCDGRLAARRKARETGGLSLPVKTGGWDVARPATQGRA